MWCVHDYGTLPCKCTKCEILFLKLKFNLYSYKHICSHHMAFSMVHDNKSKKVTCFWMPLPRISLIVCYLAWPIQHPLTIWVQSMIAHWKSVDLTMKTLLLHPLLTEPSQLIFTNIIIISHGALSILLYIAGWKPWKHTNLWSLSPINTVKNDTKQSPAIYYMKVFS